MNPEQLFSISLDMIADPFGVFRAVRDDEGRIVDFQIESMNLAAAAMHPQHGTRDKLVGQRLLQMDPAIRDCGLFDAYATLVEQGEPLDREFVIRKRTIQVRAAKIEDGLAAQWRDVTERSADLAGRTQQLRELALALADAEARERKRLAQVLHDHFQQLLSAAKLKAGIVRRISLEQKTKEGAQQVERLLEDAIAASRSLTAELSPPVLYDAGLNAAIEVLARALEKRHGLMIALALDSRAEPLAEQVRVLIFDAVRELLENVFHHANADSIRITTGVASDGQIQVIVSDDGQGFNAEAMSAPQNNAGTSHFGLFEIRERLSFLGGQLEIESAAGNGSRLTLRVPAELRPAEQDDVAPAASSAAPAPAAHSLPARVIVADDHAIFREGLISLLAQEPMLQVIAEASDGEQAIELTRQLRPQILLLDITMPKLNGVQVASILSREMPELRMVGISMHERQDMAEAMRAAGAVAYLTKGGSSETLLSTLRSLLHDPTGSPPLCGAAQQRDHEQYNADDKK